MNESLRLTDIENQERTYRGNAPIDRSIAPIKRNLKLTLLKLVPLKLNPLNNQLIAKDITTTLQSSKD